jgi:hypothetical protein
MNPGVYDVKIVAAGLCSSQSGNPGVWITVDIDDGFGRSEEMTGKIWITEKAMGMARGQLKAVGFDYRALDLTHDNVQAIVGNECSVTLKEETYKNRTEVKISLFGSNAPPSPEALAAATRSLRAAKDDGEEKLPPRTLPKQPRTHQDLSPAQTPPKAPDPAYDVNKALAGRSREPGEDDPTAVNETGDDIPF